MANLVGEAGDAASNIVQGTGTASVTFTMPNNVALSVESVVATVDNTAGGATTGELVIKDQSGQVIATKRQGTTIPAGYTGTATWALRLDDDTGTGSGFIRFNFDNEGGYLDITANATDAAGSTLGG